MTAALHSDEERLQRDRLRHAAGPPRAACGHCEHRALPRLGRIELLHRGDHLPGRRALHRL